MLITYLSYNLGFGNKQAASFFCSFSSHRLNHTTPLKRTKRVCNQPSSMQWSGPTSKNYLKELLEKFLQAIPLDFWNIFNIKTIK